MSGSSVRAHVRRAAVDVVSVGLNYSEDAAALLEDVHGGFRLDLAGSTPTWTDELLQVASLFEAGFATEEQISVALAQLVEAVSAAAVTEAIAAASDLMAAAHRFVADRAGDDTAQSMLLAMRGL